MTTKPLDDHELEILDEKYPPASVLALNEIPLEYGSYRIIQVAVKFMYDDGSNDDKGVHCDIPYNQSVTVVASNKGCCRSYFCLMQVRVPGGQVQTVSNTANTPNGYCGGQVRWRLGIARSFKKGKSYQTDEPQLELIADKLGSENQ